METKFCQSCGMPIEDVKEACGTDKDGRTNEDYCKYCYDGGVFLTQHTMEEMINDCAPYVAKSNPDMSVEDAKAMMQEFFPTLKRWKQ